MISCTNGVFTELLLMYIFLFFKCFLNFFNYWENLTWSWLWLMTAIYPLTNGKVLFSKTLTNDTILSASRSTSILVRTPTVLLRPLSTSLAFRMATEFSISSAAVAMARISVSSLQSHCWILYTTLPTQYRSQVAGKGQQITTKSYLLIKQINCWFFCNTNLLKVHHLKQSHLVLLKFMGDIRSLLGFLNIIINYS